MTAFVPADPVEPLDADTLGKALGNLSAETVRLMEQRGELFSIVRVQRNRGPEYPAFQAWPRIAGEPLARVLVALRAENGPAAYGFFTTPNQDLARLTPIEVLIGRVTRMREFEPGAAELLEISSEQRLQAVLVAAQAYAADLAA